MSEAKLFFFSEDVDYTFQHTDVVKKWLYDVANAENSSILSANIIFCSDAYIFNINKQYLSHDYFTDIITFPMMEEGAPIEADIFISIDTVRSNAEERSLAFDDELLRVIVHGFLHMLGYGDKTENESIIMKSKEDYYLDYFFNKY